MRILLTILLGALLACSDTVANGPSQPSVPDSGPGDGGQDAAGPGQDAGGDAVDMGDLQDGRPPDAELDSGDSDADAVDMGSDVPTPEPLEAPADTWTWIDIPGTRCADGSPTGLGLNVHPGATKLLIFFDGGGACYNYATCFGVVRTALHLSGYDARTFDGLLTRNSLNALIFDREDPKNPLRDAHYVFLPYCTGDIFVGDAEVELESALGARKTIHFHGQRNVEAYLTRVAATWPAIDHVVVAGTSAGGLGAAVSWPQVRSHFPNRRVDLIDDSGPPIEPADGIWTQWISAWSPTLPPDCPNCGTSAREVRNYARRLLTATDDGSRIAFLSSARDPVISTFMGLRPSIFEERVRQMCEEFGDEPRAQCFVIPEVLHVLLVGHTENEAGGLPLWRWLELMVSGDEGWNTTLP